LAKTVTLNAAILTANSGEIIAAAKQRQLYCQAHRHLGVSLDVSVVVAVDVIGGID
jgi:hypothetical protein